MGEEGLFSVKTGMPNESTLYLAVETNDKETVQRLLTASAVNRDQLEYKDPAHGWTALFVASIGGYTSIVELLLDAGAQQDIVDLAGWTAKEHAVFRGHLSLAELFAPRLQVPSGHLAPNERFKVSYKRQSNESQIFIYLGPSHTRSNLQAVALISPLEDHLSLAVRINTQDSRHGMFEGKLPLGRNTVNQPVVLPVNVNDIASIVLRFEVVCHDARTNIVHTIGIATYFPGSLKDSPASRHESLIRHHIAPIIQKGTMACIGSLTSSVLIITPYRAKSSLPKRSPGFWTSERGYPIVGHRGSGANVIDKSVLQIGENTHQSFLTAIDRGASSIEFDIQLTKDLQPVIYHDFLVKETGGDILVQDLTLEQFQHYSRSQAPKGDRLSSREQKYIEQALLRDGETTKSRRHSLNEYDDIRGQDLLDRIKNTDEGLRGNFKGNIRGLSIQEPSMTLYELLTSIPEHIAFDLEIKYPMLWEAEDRNMSYNIIELNTYVDTILDTIFFNCKHRNITLTSFSPEVCIALACKQSSFPILQITKAGTVPVGDVRAGSLKGALDFAMAWGLDGLVVKADPLVMCPRLLKYVKDAGLVVATYGDLNNDVKSAKVGK